MGVEGLEVDCRTHRELFELTLSRPGAGDPSDRVLGVLEAAAGGFDRGQFPQPVGVQFLRQVQDRIGRIQVAFAAPAVGEAGDVDRAEHGLQRPDMLGLNAAVCVAVDVGDLRQARLTGRPQVQMVLVEQPDQFPNIDRQPGFELTMGQAAGLLVAQERTDLLELGAADVEGRLGKVAGVGGVGAAAGHGIPPRSVPFSVTAVRSERVDIRASRCQEATR